MDPLIGLLPVQSVQFDLYKHSRNIIARTYIATGKTKQVNVTYGASTTPYNPESKTD